MKNLIGMTVLATALIGTAGGAYAGATVTVDGVTFPVGLVPGGNQSDTSTLFETPVANTGDLDQGVGLVTAINQNGNPIWTTGQNGVELAYTFTYIADVVVAPTSTTAGTATFSSGVVNFYVLPAGTQINSLPGGITADIAAVQAGTLFASTVAPAETPGGDVLTSIIPAGSTLEAFSAGHGQGFLDVTGGDAGDYFHTGTFANAFDTINSPFPGFSDMSFTSDFSSGGGGDFGIAGSSTLKANAVPEPISLGMVGVGLLALGAVRRRRRG